MLNDDNVRLFIISGEVRRWWRGTFFFNEEKKTDYLSELNHYLRVAEIKRSFLVGCILLFVMAAVFVASYVRIPITKSATGIVFPVEGAASIYNSKAIHRIYAHNGQNLRQGDAILQYTDGSEERMPADGLLISVNRNLESAGSGGKVASYIPNAEQQQIFAFLPLEQSMDIEVGQKVNLIPKFNREADKSNYQGTVAYISDSFFYPEEVVDFIGSTDMAITLVEDLSGKKNIYRLVGITSDRYTARISSQEQATYDNYINMMCHVTITLRDVSIREYLFSGRW